ncbi:MAG: hypothetical protein HBSIN02_06250 [Bacteroidia bacterium]|nr:MAG: hypothetical protein HBSIN02_06250 [Bacteroidia bacterium]
MFDLKVLKEGIPDKAFEPLEGDDKTAARTFAQRNRDERKGQEDLFGRNIEFPLNEFSAHSYEIDAIADDSPDTIRRKKQLFEKSHDDPAWQRYKRACDLWTAAFFQPLKPDSVPITSGALADHLNGRPIDARVMGLATLYSHQQAFFHWPLEFPEVFAAGEHPESEGSHSGFHVVLSNPPWERIKLQEQEFFAVRDARIANAPTKAARARMIEELPKTSPRLYEEYVAAQRSSQAASMLLRHGGRYPLTGRGDINTYAVFAELSRRLIAKDGRCGIIVPTGIATDDTTKFFFQDMTRSGALVNLFDFENRKGIFPAIDSRMKFSLLTCRGSGKPEPATFVFFALDTDDLKRPEKRFTLTAEEIELLNPNTGNCPIFRSQADAELTKAIYRRVPVLWRERTEDRPEENPWRLSFKTLFHMANDSHHFRTAKELREEGFELEGNIFVKGIANGQGQMESADHSQFATRYLPLYEAKMIHQFDHRWATYEERMVNGEWQVEVRDVTDEEKADPNFVVQPRYWVKEEIVESVIPKYPEPLATALRLKHRPSIQRVLSCWLAGYYLNHKLKPKADRVMDNAVPYSPNKEVATLLAGLSTDELAAQMEREFPLSDEDARRIENELSSPESIATELVDRFSPKWFLGWRNITNTTNERTLITTSFPKTPVGNSLPLLFTTSLAGTERLCLTACMSSVVADYVTRQKVGGTNLNYFYLKQFSILVPENFGGLMPFSNREVTKDWIVSRTLELVYTSHDMVAMAHDVGFQGEPFRWDPDRRFEIRCELDAAFFHLYLPCEANGEWRMANREWAVVDETPEQLAALKEHFPRPRDAVSYILEQFPIVKRKDEEAYGRYRTKERILEIYDAMLEAQRTGKPYKSSLNPPPGHPA